jgi:hypothetical protein
MKRSTWQQSSRTRVGIDAVRLPSKRWLALLLLVLWFGREMEVSAGEKVGSAVEVHVKKASTGAMMKCRPRL